MLKVVVNKVHTYFVNSIEVSEKDSVILKYMIEVIINDISKITIMFLLALLFGQGLNYLYGLITLLLIRSFSGGIHFKTYWGCLSFTSVFFATCILALNNINLTNKLVFLFSVFIYMTLFLLAPIVSKTRGIYSKKKRTIFKVVAIVIVTMHIVFYFYTNKNTYFTMSIWLLTLQSIQLWYAKCVKR